MVCFRLGALAAGVSCWGKQKWSDTEKISMAPAQG